jgi:hypothetical protein
MIFGSGNDVHGRCHKPVIAIKSGRTLTDPSWDESNRYCIRSKSRHLFNSSKESMEFGKFSIRLSNYKKQEDRLVHLWFCCSTKPSVKGWEGHLVQNFPGGGHDLLSFTQYLKPMLNSRYQILHPLQEGGFGHTFLAEDTQLPSRRRCVIKQLKPIHNNPELYQLIQDRFRCEAVIQENLGKVCQQIPSLYAYFSEEDNFYLVQEWIQGNTLRQQMTETGRFSEAAVWEFLTQLLSVIETVHEHQIIHRDIKPNNIILKRDRQKAAQIFRKRGETTQYKKTVNDPPLIGV